MSTEDITSFGLWNNPNRSLGYVLASGIDLAARVLDVNPSLCVTLAWLTYLSELLFLHLSNRGSCTRLMKLPEDETR